jgi:hypothetical protein
VRITRSGTDVAPAAGEPLWKLAGNHLSRFGPYDVVTTHRPQFPPISMGQIMIQAATGHSRRLSGEAITEGLHKPCPSYTSHRFINTFTLHKAPN